MRLVATSWPDAPRQTDLRLLDDGELDRVRWFAGERDAAGFAAGRALLRRVVGDAVGMSPREVRLDAPRGHAPRVTGSEIACSVSRGGDVVLVAVDEAGRVGVDVERLDPALDAAERAALSAAVLGGAGADEDETLDGFYRRWTLTEAVLKALGTGFDTDGVVDIALLGDAAWRLATFEPAPGHVAAVAADRPTTVPDLEWLG